MKYCPNCGAQIPDNAKFCTACGTPIDAPDEATVIISDPEETTVDAGEIEPAGEDGEFVAASWTAPKKHAPQVAEAPRPEPKAEPRVEPRQEARAVETGPIVQPVKPKGKGFFHYLWLYIKIIILVVVIVLAAVFIKGVFDGIHSSSSEAPVQEAPAAPAASKTLQVGSDDGFQSLDDMSLQDRVEYWEELVRSAYEEIAEEERKGDKADDARILELGLFIEDLRSKIDQVAQ